MAEESGPEIWHRRSAERDITPHGSNTASAQSPAAQQPSIRVGRGVLVMSCDERPASPPPPPPLRCDACARRLGLDGPVWQVETERARVAVKAAFDELQPALLEAITHACAQAVGPRPALRRGASAKVGVPRKEPPAVVGASFGSAGSEAIGCMCSESEDAPSRLQPEDVPEKKSSDGAGPHGQRSTAAMLRRALSRSRTQASQMFDTDSMRPKNSGPISVQSLEANLAQALLQNSRAGQRMTTARSRRAMSRNLGDDLDQASTRRTSWVSVMPDPTDDMPTAQREGSPPKSPKLRKMRIMDSTDANCGDSDSDDFEPVESMPSSRIRNKSRTMTSDQILQQRITELAEEASRSLQWAQSRSEPNDPDTISRLRAMPIAFFILGLLRWSPEKRPCASMLYRWVMRFIVAIAVITYLLPATIEKVFAPDTQAASCGNGVLCWQRGVLAQLPLPVGAAIVFMQFALQRHQDAVEDTFLMLRDVSIERGFQGGLLHRARVEKVGFVLIWICIVGSDALERYFDPSKHASVASLLNLVSVGICSAVMLCVTYGMVRVCHSLSTYIDAFCCEVVGKMQLREVAHCWNMTQATLRKASSAVQNCFFALFVVLAFTVPCLLADGLLGSSGDGQSAEALIPGLLVTAGILYALVLAAMISEKCTRVPALINAISFGDGTDRVRQFTVDYITSSAAGFYVFGMRLTSAMVAKLIYGWCIVAFGLLSRSLAGGGSGGLGGFGI